MFPSLLPLSFYKAFAVQKLRTDQGCWCRTIYQSFPTNNFHGIKMQYNDTANEYILYGILFIKVVCKYKPIGPCFPNRLKRYDLFQAKLILGVYRSLDKLLY